MSFLDGIKLSRFCDTHQEWHALVNGWCEIICPWPPFRKVMSKALAEELANEYHYYNFGRVLGLVSLIGIILGVIKVVS